MREVIKLGDGANKIFLEDDMSAYHIMSPDGEVQTIKMDDETVVDLLEILKDIFVLLNAASPEDEPTLKAFISIGSALAYYVDK